MILKPRTGAGAGGRSAFHWKMFAAGMVAIVLGYVLLAVNNITIAPLLLVLGYCILVPLAFLL